MCKRIYIILQAVISYIAIAYCGPRVVEGQYIWLDNFTEAFRGFGINGVLIPIMLIIFYHYVDEKKVKYANDNNIVISTSLIFSLIMAIGKFFQYRVVSLETKCILYFQIFLIPILYSGFYYLFKRVIKMLLHLFDNIEEGNRFKFNEFVFDQHYILLSVFTLLLCYLPYIIAFYPASISFDGAYQIGEYLNLFAKTDHHPPFVTLLYGFFANLYEKFQSEIFLFFLVIIQLILLVIAIILVLKLMKKCKLPYKVRWITLLFYSLFTVFPVFTVTIIKDSLYYPLTLIYTVFLSFGVLFPDEYLNKKFYYVGLVITLIFLILTRNNGIYTLILSFPLFILFTKKYKIQLCLVLLCVLCITSGINQKFYSMGIKKLNFKIDMFTVMLQQTARYGAEHLDDVTPEEDKSLDEIFEYWRLPYEYNPRNADFAKNCLRVDEESEKYILEDRMGDYLKIWLNQLSKHPMSYISSFIESSYGYYYPDIKEAYEGLGWYRSINPASEVFHYSDAAETKSFRSFLEGTAYFLRDFPITGILYSCGFYAWIVISAFIYLIMHKQGKLLICIMPSIVNILVCCVSPISGYIRYALPVIAAAPVIFTLVYWHRKNLEERY